MNQFELFEKRKAVARRLRRLPVAREPGKADSTGKSIAAPSATAHIECRDNLEFMARLPDASMKLIVTSPPYNIGKSYERRTPLETYVKAQQSAIAACVRLLRPDGSICWQIGNHVQDGQIFPLDILLYPEFAKHGLKLRNRIVWHFEHGLHCTNRLSGRHETILWFTKGDGYTFNLDEIRVRSKYPGKKFFKGPRKGELSGNPLGKNPGDVWIFPNVKNNHVEKTIHPCQFPVELAERLVLSLTKAGDSVLDPFMGVGTSVVAAVMHGRDGYGCDIVQDYVDIASERIEQVRSGVLKTRPMSKPVYDPSLPNGGASVRIVTYYSHLNGLEFLLVHKPLLWEEIQSGIDAKQCRTKVSKEIRTKDKLLYSPIAMNAALSAGFSQRGWGERRTSYWVTANARLIRRTMHMKPAEQRVEIVAAGETPISSYNQTDFVKERVAVEVQFGKYAFVAYDLFVKHMAFFVGDVIDVGIEILPMKELRQEMSSGVGYYEGELYNLIREGRGVPGVPLVLVGVAPDLPAAAGLGF